MHDTLDGVRLVHDTDPGAEAGIVQTVAEAREGVGDNKDGKWRMGGENGVCDDVAYRRHDGDAALTEPAVDAGVGEGCQRVACEGGQEDE